MIAHDHRHLSVSLNGVDNVGKTTQLAWLHRGVTGAHLVGTVDAWDFRWREVASGDFGHWWFAGSTTAEHVGLMVGSHVARRAASEPLALEDRGWPMLRAACAATAALKEDLSPAEALELVDHLTADLPIAAARHEVHILLRRTTNPAREAVEALRREPNPVGERYAAYQRTLAEVLAIQVQRGEYHAVLDTSVTPRSWRSSEGSGVFWLTWVSKCVGCRTMCSTGCGCWAACPRAARAPSGNCYVMNTALPV